MYEELENIGLTKSEVAVYVTLLKIGQSSTGKIVKNAKISSGKIYEILEKLIDKGLVSFILINNVKHYKSSDPKEIKKYITKKKQEIERKELEINKLLPQLSNLKKSSKKEYSAEIYMGFNGIKTAIMESLENIKSEYLSLGGSSLRNKEYMIMWNQVFNILSKKKIKIKNILSDTSEKSMKELKQFSFKISHN